MSKVKTYQIAIDGPSGVGKSSIAKNIAEKLNFVYINTGAMYRCYALALKNNNIDINNINLVMQTLNQNKVELKEQKVFLNDNEVTDKLNNPEIAALASKIATFQLVREKCVADQQKIAANINCVMEGRDITSVVLPNATLKIYLDADVKLRADRRWKQYNKSEPYEVVLQKIKNRDYQDTHRQFSPLIKVPDAFVINDKGSTIDEISDIIIKKFKEITNE
ncbi:MAG: (d)CMP kinase [Mycoplasma sp.]|nr:(d)CMP kinase [Mycoplasma sp.]